MEMFNPPHPGLSIEELLEFYGLSINAAARALFVAPSTLHRVMRGETSVSPEMAVKLETVGMGMASHWLAMQAAYDVWQARHNLDLTAMRVLDIPTNRIDHHA